MIIDGYGVTLTRLTYDKIELVRQWRNSDSVRRYMIYQQEITPQMQQMWFNSINNDMNYYFIISYNGEELGLSNIKNISKTRNDGEGGIFIAKEEWLCSSVAVRASLCGLDFDFERLGLDEIYIHVQRENLNAIRYNKAFGFIEEPFCRDDTFLKMRLTAFRYYQQREKLIELITY